MKEIILPILSVFGILIAPTIYSLRRMYQNYLFNKSNIEGFHISTRYFDSKKKPIVELIRIKSRFTNIIGETIYYYKKQNYQLNLKFTKQHLSVISGTWKNKNDPYHYGNFIWNFNFKSNESKGCWNATERDGKIEFGSWELKKLDKSFETILNERLFPKKITLSKILKKKDSASTNDQNINDHTLYNNMMDKHDKEPEKTFTFNKRKYTIMKNVFNPQYGKIGTRLIKHLLEKYDLKKYKNILDWGTGCGYYSIEIALKQKDLNTEYNIVALESDKNARLCAKNNILKFNLTDKIKLLDSNRISNNELKTKFDLVIANMPFSKPKYLKNYKKHPMYNCFCSPPELVLEICFELKNALNNNGVAVLSYADSGDREFLFKCLEFLNMTIKELFRVDKKNGATDDIFYAYEIKNKC